jgi:hypothetical protein
LLSAVVFFETKSGDLATRFALITRIFQRFDALRGHVAFPLLSRCFVMRLRLLEAPLFNAESFPYLSIPEA